MTANAAGEDLGCQCRVRDSSLGESGSNSRKLLPLAFIQYHTWMAGGLPHCSGGITRQQRQDKTHPKAGCEFALPFVFPPYFADTYGGKEDDFSLAVYFFVCSG